ncbi:2'-5' RNA ligase family protein [Virgibacillus senegalensis]|uniref:2'-5' RNA ligase family protein n=1 Tax=Virgibacillus senegalensis TaxID=1499679 RepID=UPI00069D63D5|nr:2'-5' RNA ligase family protein [Virgibacillus senegalensis]
MYALIALFDKKTETCIENIWQELKERSISSYAYEVEDRKPHLTLASYHVLKVEEFKQQMESTYKKQPILEIKFNTIGSFLNSRTLIFSPNVTKELIELHERHHQDFERFHDIPDSLYLPGNWVPHCTLANRLSSYKRMEAFDYVSKRYNGMVGKIVELALIDVSQPSKAPIIYSKNLQSTE